MGRGIGGAPICRAFSPLGFGMSGTWGVAPGWYMSGRWPLVDGLEVDGGGGSPSTRGCRSYTRPHRRVRIEHPADGGE